MNATLEAKTDLPEAILLVTDNSQIEPYRSSLEQAGLRVKVRLALKSLRDWVPLPLLHTPEGSTYVGKGILTHYIPWLRSIS